MSEQSPAKSRRELAAALLVLVALALPVLLLAGNRAWGSIGLPEHDHQAPGAQQRREALPEAGKRWVRELTPEERNWMMGAFLGTVQALQSGRRPDLADAPALCRAELGAPLFVTLYRPPGHVLRRIYAQQPTLAAAVRQAARESLLDLSGRGGAENVRVHMTVVRRAVPLGAEQRMAFVQRRFGEPTAVGVATENGREHVLLPVDAAATIDTTARSQAAGTAEGLHGEMLEIVCKQAGLSPGAWRRADRVPMWLLEVDAFVNAPGTTRALAGARTLLRQGDIATEDQLASLRAAVQYLGRSQAEDGSYTIIYASGLTIGCSSIVQQCETADAAAHATTWLTGEADDSLLNVSLEGVAYAVVNDMHREEHVRMAYVHREEPCRDVMELDATAQTLAALCRYALAGGRRPVAEDVLLLMNFLMYMERPEGGFYLRYDSESRRRWTPQEHADSLIPAARSAYALSLAHEWLQAPEALIKVRNCMEHLLDRVRSRTDPLSPSEVRWLAQAMMAHARHDPIYIQEYAEVLGPRARGALERQVGPKEAPHWDIVGGSGMEYPPTAASTAQDMIIMLAARRMGADIPGLQGGIDAARGFLLRMQFTEANTYPFADAKQRMGAYRAQSDRKLLTLSAVATAIEALTLDLELRTQENTTQ